MKTSQRASGILMHISSLPSLFAIGDMGPQARIFIRELKKMGQSVWQILPLNPTLSVCGHSPYSSTSAFAGNTLLISPEDMVNDNLLESAALKPYQAKSGCRVDYQRAEELKQTLLEIAFQKFRSTGFKNSDYKNFYRQHKAWLDDYALFCVLKQHHRGAVWVDWPDAFRYRDAKALSIFAKEHHASLERIYFEQYVFFKQWQKLKTFANQQGLEIFGDIPIYVQFDSADVWQNPQVFLLNSSLTMDYVSGVPPDYFSETGQRWGNPIYHWRYLKKDRYRWWLERLKHNGALYDIVRIDHFRGLVQYWAIPATEPTAIKGRWCHVPTNDFLKCVFDALPEIQLVAEDLGIITDDVREVMNVFQLPGMKILQFAFNEDLNKHPYLPHNCHKNSIVYTGTHDNNTVVGWFNQDMTDKELETLRAYCQMDVNVKSIHQVMVKLAMMSAATLVITPWQDVLGLDEKARMNTPGTTQGNWMWQAETLKISSEQSQAYFDLVKCADRIRQLG